MHLLGSSSVPHSNGVVITSSYFSEPEVKVTRYAETLSKKSLYLILGLIHYQIHHILVCN